MLLRFYNIIYDVSNLFHVSYNVACKKLGVGTPSENHPDLRPETSLKPTELEDLNKHASYEFFMRVEKIDNEFRHLKGTSYFLLDSKDEALNSQYGTRKLESSKYKQGRTRKSDNFYSLLKFVCCILRSLDETYILVAKPSFEADDLVKPVLDYETVSDTQTSTLLVSNDLDWARAVNNDSVHILKDHRVQDLNIISKNLGLIPNQNRIIMYKMAFGDKIDGIEKPEQLKGHKKDLLKFINSVSCPNEMIHPYPDTYLNVSDTLREKLSSSETRKALEQNYNLIDYLPFNDDIIKYFDYGSFQPEVLKRYIKILGLEPENIRNHLSERIGWVNYPPFLMGGFLE